MRANGAEGLKAALTASIGARSLSAIIGLLAVPVYLEILGIEAYGVIGLFATLQALLVFMDFGLGTALTRQLAITSQRTGAMPEGRDLAFTLEWTYVAVACLIGALLMAVSPVLAESWINLGALSLEAIAFPLQLGSLALAFGWPSNLYVAGLTGLQRQVPLAVSTSLLAMFRVGLSIAFLWHTPTLASFFLSQLAASILQSAVMRNQLWRSLAWPGHKPATRWALLLNVRQFAGGMTVITITIVLLTQIDKMILSHLLTLQDFGMYVLAGNIATGMYLAVTPMFSIIFPRLSAYWNAGDVTGVADLYHTSSQAMAWLVMPVTAVMACFPAQSLFVFTNNRVIAEYASVTLVYLALGAALNGIMSVPYALQLAAAWTGLTVRINLAAVALIVPLTWWGAEHYGASGGAAAWGFLNLVFLLLTPQLLHRHLLRGEKWQWYFSDVLIPGAASFAAALALATVWPVGFDSRWVTLLQLFICWLLCALITLACLSRLRAIAVRTVWR